MKKIERARSAHNINTDESDDHGKCSNDDDSLDDDEEECDVDDDDFYNHNKDKKN